MQMIHSIQSNPTDYSILKASIDIPWRCNRVKYYVSAINTKANILVSTTNDFIEFNGGKKILFPDAFTITIDDLISLFNCSAANVILSYNKNKRVFNLKGTGVAKTIVSISHRASLLLGLYNTADLTTIDISGANGYDCSDIPVLDYGNKFYLISLWGGPIYSSNKYTPTVLSSIDTFIKDGLPMLVNYDSFTKPIKVKTNVESMSCIEMQLVDFQFKPIIIKSPIFVTLKIKPIDI